LLKGYSQPLLAELRSAAMPAKLNGTSICPAGDIPGPYEIFAPIGAGGMGSSSLLRDSVNAESAGGMKRVRSGSVLDPHGRKNCLPVWMLRREGCCGPLIPLEQIFGVHKSRAE